MEKIIELSKRFTLNELQEKINNVPEYLNEYSSNDFEQAYKLKKERIFKAPYFVTMVDKFMSGWGYAKGKTNKLVIACNNFKEAQTVQKNALNRPEMKYVNISLRPNVKSHHYPSYKHIEDLGEIWTK
jgi:hypothetical protein